MVITAPARRQEGKELMAPLTIIIVTAAIPTTITIIIIIIITFPLQGKP